MLVGTVQVAQHNCLFCYGVLNISNLTSIVIRYFCCGYIIGCPSIFSYGTRYITISRGHLGQISLSGFVSTFLVVVMFLLPLF